MKKVYVIAGEASGDLHGARLIEEIRSQSAEPVEIYGVGGDRIRRTGARNFFDLAHFHVTGLTDAIKRFPQYKKAEKAILADIQKSRPDTVVLIDNPGFNLHLAGRIHALGIPVIYYIAPQVWAWAPKRLLKIKACVQKVLVVFEFEKKIYEKHGIPVVWVGHPLKDLIRDVKGLETQKPLICLLPGSRKGELKMLFPILAKSAKKIAETLPGAHFALIKAPTLSKEFYADLMKTRLKGISCRLIEHDAYPVIKQSDLALVCSGTATLECALLGTPMIITNKGTLLTYLAAKSLIRVPYLGLPNLILGKHKFPELLQYDATPEKIAKTAVHMLTDKTLRESLKKELEEVSRKLGEPGASRRAAHEVLRTLFATK